MTDGLCAEIYLVRESLPLFLQYWRVFLLLNVAADRRNKTLVGLTQNDLLRTELFGKRKQRLLVSLNTSSCLCQPTLAAVKRFAI